MNIALAPAEVAKLLDSPALFVLPDRLYGTIRLLFDRAFYLARYPDVEAAGIDGLDHFLTCGLQEGRTPHPLFDPQFYAAQLPSRADMPPFLHYLRHGAQNKLDPHPLFDTRYYIRQTDGRSMFGQLPLSHFITAGTRAQLSPNPLFDAVYYRRVNQLGAAHPRHPILHYVAQGWREGCRTHPLFDVAHYLSLRPDVVRAGVDPLAHYLRQGCHEQTTTHELFDLAYYRAQFEGMPSEQDEIDQLGGIIHFAANASRALPSPHPLFDPVHYQTTQFRGEAAGTAPNPFLHFIEHGMHALLDPHPLFDQRFYRDHYPDLSAGDGSPFLHFVRSGAELGNSPAPFFDAGLYLSGNPQARGCRFGALSHYLASQAAEPIATCIGFDPLFYAECARAAGHAVRGRPLLHFLTTGRPLGLTPTAPDFTALEWSTCDARVTAKSPDARVVLLISPDAGPGPIADRALHAASCLAADADILVHVALVHGGSREAEFTAVGPTLVMTGTTDPARLLYAFARDTKNGIVIINSAEMPDLVHLAGSIGLNVVAWLHEMPVSIDRLLGGSDTMQSLLAQASHVVTGSFQARNAICSRYGADESRVHVLRHGLDRTIEDGGSPDDARRAGFAVRQELGMAPDALLVLAGGPVDFRSGADLFIQIAHTVVQLAGGRAAPGAPDAIALAQVHFVWVGDQPDRLFAGFCHDDVRKLGLAGRVHFLTGRDRLARLAKTADMFLMTARAEAFDESAILAGQAGLKLIGFEGGVSPADLPASQKITLVPYLDVDALAGCVMRLGKRPSRRRPRAASPPHDPGHPEHDGTAFPSWARWHDGLRRILMHAFPDAPVC